MQEYFWLYFLDVFPHIYLQYVTIRNQLRFSYVKTMVIANISLVVFQIVLAVLSVQRFHTAIPITYYRLSQLIMLIGLTIALTKKQYAKSLFINGFIVPYMMAVLGMSTYLIHHIPGIEPSIVNGSIARLIIYIVTFPAILYLFTRCFTEAMNFYDETIYRYICPIPIGLTLVSIMCTQKNYVTKGILLRDLVARLIILASVFAIGILLLRLLRKLKEKTVFEEQVKRGKMLLRMQQNEYEELMETIESNRKMRHDMRHHLNAIATMIQNKEYETIDRYINNVLEWIPVSKTLQVCENYAVNAIVSYYIQLAEEKHIQTSYQLDIAKTISISSTDLCVIFGNCIENSIEALEQVPEEERKLRIVAKLFHSQMSIIVDNTYVGTSVIEQGRFLSRKRGYTEMGIGISSVEAIVNQYDGMMKIECDGGKFMVSILLNLEKGDMLDANHNL